MMPPEFRRGARSSKYRLFGNWQPSSTAYSALSLNVNASAPGWDTVPDGGGCIGYSVNGGASWTSIQCDQGPGWPQQTFTVTLAAAQNLSLLRVGACVFANSSDLSNPGADVILVHDIWTSGTYAGQGGGSGSGKGRRNPVLIF